MRQSYAVNRAQDRDTHQTRELSVYPQRKQATTLDRAYHHDDDRKREHQTARPQAHRIRVTASDLLS
jgi:hypothetical protein